MSKTQIKASYLFIIIFQLSQKFHAALSSNSPDSHLSKAPDFRDAISRTKFCRGNQRISGQAESLKIILFFRSLCLDEQSIPFVDHFVCNKNLGKYSLFCFENLLNSIIASPFW